MFYAELPGQHQAVQMRRAQAEWSQLERPDLLVAAVDFEVPDLKPQTRAAWAPPDRCPPGS